MSKEQFKRIAFAACLTLTGVMASCVYDVESDRIYYNITSITSSTDLEVEVTYKDTSYNSYSGDIEIPSIVNVKYNNKIYTVTSIGDSAFYDCWSLTSIDLPDGLTSIGKSAFWECTSLTSIDLPDGLTSIGEDAFSRCWSLTSIDLPDGLTSIGDGAFYNCSRLTSIDVNENNTYYSSSDGVLYNKDKTILICYPGGKINSTFSIPESVTKIGSYAFSFCKSLTSIDLPDGLTSIGSYAFSYCTSLTSIDLPDGLTNIVDFAFHYCTSLKSIDLPDGLTSIGDYAFHNCENLKVVYSRNVTPPTCASSDVFDDTTYENATLHVPSEALTSYQTTSPWSKFNNIVGDATNNGNSRRVHK